MSGGRAKCSEVCADCSHDRKRIESPTQGGLPCSCRYFRRTLGWNEEQEGFDLTQVTTGNVREVWLVMDENGAIAGAMADRDLAFQFLKAINGGRIQRFGDPSLRGTLLGMTRMIKDARRTRSQDRGWSNEYDCWRCARRIRSHEYHHRLSNTIRLCESCYEHFKKR